MEKCKDSVPCWVMPLYKVAETINPEQGMYDYVIIDEASQLGADAIFLLYISKNIIIVGDDKQTSPEYVGVDANTMTPHINRHLQGIPFANFYGTEFSFFDHAKMFCKGMTVLREHFRCMPEIIEFCNKYFYAPEGKGLYPLKQYSENRIEPLKSVYCQSGYIDGSYQNIINKVEAEAIANKIAELTNDENYKGKSFGVIGLQGNKQATIIEHLIIKKIGEVEFKKRGIVCGTSASFQGDERDVMFLSLVTANNHKRAALVKSEDERRFNVAVSRAKEQVWLFHSVLLDDLSNTNDLRYKLLDHFLNYRPQPIPPQITIPRNQGTQPEPFESWFEVDVYNDIVTNNYKVIPQYEVAKGRYRIDLVTLLSNGVKIAIECDGDKYHGAEQFTNDLMRQRVLERCGWQFFRVRGGEYYSNRKKALEPLWRLIEKNEINTVNTVSTEYQDIYKSIDKNPQIIKTKNIDSIIKDDFNSVLYSKPIKEWETKTCFWSSIEKPGYKYSLKRDMWVKSKKPSLEMTKKNIEFKNGKEEIKDLSISNGNKEVKTKTKNIAEELKDRFPNLFSNKFSKEGNNPKQTELFLNDNFRKVKPMKSDKNLKDKNSQFSLGKNQELDDLNISVASKRFCYNNKLDNLKKLLSYYQKHEHFLDGHLRSEETNIELIKFCKKVLKEKKSQKVKKIKEEKNNSQAYEKKFKQKIGDLEIFQYSEKSIAVFGKTKEIKDELKALGGYFNPRLEKDGKKECGWIFKNDKEEIVINLMNKLEKM